MTHKYSNTSVVARSPTASGGTTKAGAPAPALNRNPLTVPSQSDGTKQSPRLLRSLRSLAMTAVLLNLPSQLYAQTAVKGRVIFEGTPPSAEIVEVKSDIPTCGVLKEIQKVLLGEEQGVANVVIKILGAPGVPEPKKGTLDQVHCEFVPHVQVVPVGSNLTLTSSDPVLHNSHAFYEDGSTAFNIAVPIPGMEVSQKLDKPGVIKLRCDAGHTWMGAYIVVIPESHYALTDANGNFSIEGIPPGDYEMEAWHEWLGTQKKKVTIKEGASEAVDFTLTKS